MYGASDKATFAISRCSGGRVPIAFSTISTVTWDGSSPACFAIMVCMILKTAPLPAL